MYASHSPKIARGMRRDNAIFLRGVLFAICSIRQPIVGVPDQLAEIEEKGASAECLFGSKRDAFAFLVDHHAALRRAILAGADNAARIETLLAVPGLGIVKSAFVLQLMGYNVACLDSRNVKREGRNPRAFRTDGKPPHKLRRKIKEYLAEVEGKAAHYWDAWCADAAEVYDQTADEISALHLVICERTYTLEETFK